MSDREEFEKALAGEVGLRKDKDGSYTWREAQAAWLGWQAASAQSGQGAEPAGFDFDGWYDKHESLFREGAGKADLRAAYKQGYRDSQPQPAQQGVPECLREHLERIVKLHNEKGVVLTADIDHLQELLTTTPQPESDGCIPEGWKLVPVAPTGDMEEAGCQGYMEADGNWVMHRSSMGHAYRAMLDAVPQPPPPQEGEGDE